MDFREQIDLATELPAPSPNEPRYRKLRGPNQWPNDELIPGFRKTFEEYIDRMSDLSTEFTSLVCALPSCRVVWKRPTDWSYRLRKQLAYLKTRSNASLMASERAPAVPSVRTS